MAEVRLERVSKQYRGLSTNALFETSLVFEDGLFTCVLGPSGSGKTTILKLLAGIEEVTSGRIFFDDLDVTHTTPEHRDVAMVFQSYALYANMTARDNIAFPLMLRGLSRKARYERVNEVAEMLGISATLDRHPRQLSGGERQRVALGRAIVREPKVFLLDEPISNLDANLRIQTREELKRIHAELGATFIYVTHDQDDASAMGDRVVVMAGGRVHQVDSPQHVYHRPADRFVASFLGRLPMNFFRGTITDEGAEMVLRTEDGMVIELGPRPVSFRPPPDLVLVGARPESVTAMPGAQGSGGVVGEVFLTEVIPPDNYVSVSVGGKLIRARTEAGENELGMGERARLSFDLRSLHFFDIQNERRTEEVWTAPDHAQLRSAQ